MDGLAMKNRLPDSVLPYPDGLWNRIKYVFWRAITPGYLFGLNLLIKLHILHHEGRQLFVVGKLAPGKNAEDFLEYLHSRGFFNHFIAWKDDNQIVSVRKLEDFKRQYHLRVFSDGEVRGHYEYTPEAHPAWHLKEVGFEQRREEFLEFVGDWVVPSQS
jgi:hypothetical protein